MTGSELRRSVATDRAAEEVAVIEVVCQTAEETLSHVVVSIRTNGTILTRTLGIVKFADDRVVEVSVVTIQFLFLLLGLLVTSKDAEVVLVGKCTCITGQILLGDREVAVRLHIGLTISGATAGKTAVQVVVASVGTGSGQIGSDAQTSNRGDVDTPLAVECVTKRLVVVVGIIADGVTHKTRTNLIGVVRVIDRTARSLLDDIVASLVLLTYIERIDGTDRVSQIEHIARTSVSTTVGRSLAGTVCERHIGGQFQPLLSLILHVGTCSVTLILRLLHLSAIVQIASAGEVTQPSGIAAYRSVILLTEGRVDGLVVPVIGQIVVLTIVATQRGIGVQLEVVAHEVLALRQGVDIVTQTTIVLVEQVVVGIGISLSLRTTIVDHAVVHSLVVGLIVLSRVGDDIIARDEAAVATPLGIEPHLSVLSSTLGLLGCDDDHTIGTTVTVDGTGRSILQHRHRLDILRVDRSHALIHRHTVDHVQRL